MLPDGIEPSTSSMSRKRASTAPRELGRVSYGKTPGDRYTWSARSGRLAVGHEGVCFTTGTGHNHPDASVRHAHVMQLYQGIATPTRLADKAGIPGFEPRTTGSEPVMLPITPYPIGGESHPTHW